MLLSDEMKLGTDETFEVWFLPSNRESYYPPRVLQEFDSIESARDYAAEKSEKYCGTLEIVRSVTTRQRTAIFKSGQKTS